MKDLLVDTNRYVSFLIGGEHYAIEVTGVKEVLELLPLTRMPKTPEFMSGIINLRGRVVPVVDLRLKLGMDKTESTDDTCIIVLEISLGDEKITLGAIADRVEEVFELQPDLIEPPPKFGTSIEADYIDGVGKYNDNFIFILKIDNIFTREAVTAGSYIDDPAIAETVPMTLTK